MGAEMKQFFIILVFFISIVILNFVGCGLARSSHLYRSYEYERLLECYIGNTMIMEESGIVNTVYNTVYPGGIRWELVYAGKSSDNVKIYYREYVATNSGWMAKDAFTQELTYDLKESKLIRYKDVRMEILTATNEKISFKVLSSKPKATGLKQTEAGVLPNTGTNTEEPDTNKTIRYLKFPLEKNNTDNSKPEESEPIK